MLAVIGGSGLAKLPILEEPRLAPVRTPYGEPSAPLALGKIRGRRDAPFDARAFGR